MKIGYPCVARGIGCTSGRTFRLSSYSDDRLAGTVESNLRCLETTLRFNSDHSLQFFRITSGLIPFASHPACSLDWQGRFRERFREIGSFIRGSDMRISMHPDQFTLINSQDEGIFARSRGELAYHAAVLDLLGLDRSAKVQIHVGGVYGERSESMRRFVRRWKTLGTAIRRRLVIENDDRNYTLRDCLSIHDRTGIPVLLDTFHHEVNCSGESIEEAFRAAARTWREDDGLLMVDYSSQRVGGPAGSHAESLDERHFREFLAASRPVDFDVMLEIKDKEHSAMRAAALAMNDPRFKGNV